MNKSFINMRKTLVGILAISTICFIKQVEAGIALGATRVIYPAEQKQVQLPVTNSDDSTYLIQSWIENSDGIKDTSFIMTPPLFAMQGKKENILRIINTKNDNLPRDRETLFWVNVKAIPSMEKSKQTENTLQLAIISRIKLYYRPIGLSIPPDQAASHLRFRRSKNLLTLINPTPYYITVTELSMGPRILDNVLVPPMGENSVKIPVNTEGEISFRTINDYGSLSPKLIGSD
ncbi:fimbria/pilus periplasmic chaperone [Klebsiella pasteurii]|uniref:fimbria/pilus periplasmic chaperone n=1 Tax=Klebsiella pasteurii TaxID=2587529 RepID=UPI00237AA06B|nr:fimbria/pilus periplasmic chaperone [Klebsiella pasteurii]MDD9665719.1 fimbria/pilus periplasmic chaperone [Klebsiella pasteurii]MDD9671193.1 fimbria/pilus periplasmic chaperone [Klebsiella pasteurii]MDD9687310.1 fimbria/pilus periplasmic chaperone [Klebsiella pasteurii]